VNMNERLSEARKKIGITQVELGKRLGMTSGAISLLESGGRNMTNLFIISVCRELGIAEEWLRTGNGNMFVITDNAIIDQLRAKGYDDLTCKFMKTYLELPQIHRERLNDELMFYVDALRANNNETAADKCANK